MWQSSYDEINVWRIWGFFVWFMVRSSLNVSNSFVCWKLWWLTVRSQIFFSSLNGAARFFKSTCMKNFYYEWPYLASWHLWNKGFQKQTNLGAFHDSSKKVPTTIIIETLFKDYNDTTATHVETHGMKGISRQVTFSCALLQKHDNFRTNLFLKTPKQ